MLKEDVYLSIEADLSSLKAELGAVGDAFIEGAPEFLLREGAIRRFKGVGNAVNAKLGPFLVDFVVFDDKGLPEVEGYGFDVANHGGMITG